MLCVEVSDMAQAAAQMEVHEEKEEIIHHDFLITSIPFDDPNFPDEHGKPIQNTHRGEYGREKKANTERLFKHLNLLIDDAVTRHREANCVEGGNQLRPERLNHVSRGITNEDFFLTEPIPFKKFEARMQELFNKAKNLPENLQFIFGSFAVLTPDGYGVMRVVPHIDCGPEPKMHLIVKNYASDVDPEFNKIDQLGHRWRLETIENGKWNRIADVAIEIDGIKRPFSFNNVVECRTAGNMKYFSCVDICLDHLEGVAKKNLDDAVNKALQAAKDGKREHIPALCTHVVTSNCVVLEKKNCITAKDQVTQCDPVHSKFPVSRSIDQVEFGTPCRIMVPSPKKCAPLPSNLAKLVKANNLAYLKSLKSLFIEGINLYKIGKIAEAKVKFDEFNKLIGGLDKTDRNNLKKIIKKENALSRFGDDPFFIAKKLSQDIVALLILKNEKEVKKPANIAVNEQPQSPIISPKAK